MKKIFETINLNIKEVEDYIEENGLSFVCNDKMQIEASSEDFEKLLSKFPELDYVEAESETRTLYVLSVSVWSADDYLNNRNTNPQRIDRYVFATKEKVEEKAKNVDANADVYNDGVIFNMELSDEQILDITGMESIEDFDEALRTPYSDSIWTKNYGEDEKDMVADYIVGQADDFEEVECANYNFDQTLDGAILVFWSWERYIGYARKLIDVRFAYHDETEAILAKQDRTYVTQCDVLLTADEVKNAGEELREAVRQELEDKHDWRWRNTSFIDTLIEQF